VSALESFVIRGRERLYIFAVLPQLAGCRPIARCVTSEGTIRVTAVTQELLVGQAIVQVGAFERGSLRATRGCEAVQHSDQKRCERCQLAWDMNDPHPPACLKEAQTLETIDVR
jgi:hypothetical protein